MESSKIHNIKMFNLTEPQKMIYLSDNIYSRTSLNTVITISKLDKQNNLCKLKEVIKEVIKENDGLHIKICLKDRIPYQYLDIEDNPSFEIVDFRDKSLKEEVEWTESLVKSNIPILNNVLYKIVLFYGFDGALNLLFMSHHIISDAWSHQSIATQVYNKYIRLYNGEKDTFRPKGSYLDYVETEKLYKESKRFNSSRDFWVSKFKKYSSLPAFVKETKHNNSVVAEQFHLEFSHDLQDKIIDICSSNNISFSTFFLACLLITLDKIKNSRSHFLGTLTYNRLGKGEKDAVGMYVNTLPLMFNLNENYSFRDIVKSIDVEMAGLLRNQRYPLREITYDKDLKHLNIAGNMDIIYTYQNIILPYEYVYNFSGCNSYPVLFRPTRKGKDGEFFLDIDYQVDYFKREEIGKIARIFESVIEQIDDISEVVNPVEKKDNYIIEYTLHGVFEDKVKKYPESTAVTCGSNSITYYELNRRANYLAKKLVDRGISIEDPVVLLMERSVELMIAILGVLKAGGCYLPLSPEQPINRSKKIIDLCGTKLVLFNHEIGLTLDKKTINIDVRDISYPVTDVPNINTPVKPDNLAYIIYTSGSTGEPKGVMIEHRSVINRLFWMQRDYPLSSSDIVMQKTPYTFDVSVWELFGWYLAGSTLHFLTPGAEKEPQTITKVIKKEKITIIHFVPSMLSLFLEYLDGYGDIEEIKSLRRVCCSGEALLLDQVKRFKSIISKNSSVNLYNLYGPTEATVEVTMMDCLDNNHDFIPIGKPIENVELYVLDKEGNTLPAGAEGELFIGGVCLARGYFNRPELTSETFVFNEKLDKRLYSSGDLATYLDDGNIKYLGRIDNQVKIRGNRVELEEIENLLLSYEGVSEAAVTSPKDDYGNTYLGAYLVSDTLLDHEDIRHFVQDQLPSYMVPSFFTQMDEFPLTSSGKLDRKSLPVPKTKQDTDRKYSAPINDREEEICEIWEDVLKREKISRDDNFFQIGGDSLNLIQVLFPLQEKYDLSLQDLFEYPTIESLSAHIHQRQGRGVSFDKDSYSRISRQWKCNSKIRDYMVGIPHEFDIEKVKHEKVLITGATGFLGVYCAREYLEQTDSELVLMVRADSIDDAEKRVKDKFSYYFSDDLFERYRRRITVVPGDISYDYFGQLDFLYRELCRSVDAVIHCAANVKHYGDREQIYQSNVIGTKRILDFCSSIREKVIYFISTVSVGLNGISDSSVFHFTEDDIITTNGEGNVYIDSKILAEDLVRSYLIEGEGQILRVGNIVSDIEEKKFQENYQDNAFYKLMFDYRERGVVPDIDIPFIDLTWVNELARAITLLTTTNYKGVLHLFNPDRITLQTMFTGNEVEVVGTEEFIEGLRSNDPILTHGYYLNDIKLLGVIPYSRRTICLLEQLNFRWSTISEVNIEELWESWQKKTVLLPN